MTNAAEQFPSRRRIVNPLYATESEVHAETIQTLREIRKARNAELQRERERKMMGVQVVTVVRRRPSQQS
jgi:hypothetical protein